jgi:hypothetical protein
MVSGKFNILLIHVKKMVANKLQPLPVYFIIFLAGIFY